MSDVILRAASEATDRVAFVDAFSAVPDRVRRHPYRVTLAPPDHWSSLLELPVIHETWIAERDGRPVGRVGAALSRTYGATGYVGLFDVDVEDPSRAAVAAALIDAASTWHGRRGVRNLYGPIDFATWFNYRLRVPSEANAGVDVEPPFAWEPVNPPEYVHWFLDAGFSEAERYCSVGFRVADPAIVEFIVAATGVAHEEARMSGFGFRQLDTKRFDAELAILYRLSMASFTDNFLFEPITFETFRQLYVGSARRPEDSWTYFVLDAQGSEIGYVFGFIDRDYAVVKTIAVRPEFRGRKLATALTHLIFKNSAARGLHQAIAALLRHGSTSEFIAARHDAVRAWRHDYALFEKRL